MQKQSAESQQIMADLKRPILLLSLSLLVLMVAFFPELNGLHKPYVTSSLMKRELFVVELVFIMTVLLDRDVRFPSPAGLPGWVLVTMMLWLVWTFLAALQAQSHLLALMTYAEHVTLLLFAVALHAMCDRYAWLKPVLLWLIVLGFAAFFVFMLIHYFPSAETFSGRYFITSMTGIGFRNIRHFGYYGGIALLVSIGLASYLSGAGKSLAYAACIIVASLAWMLLFWVGGRGPLVALLVPFPLFLLVVANDANAIKPVMFVLITLVVGALLSYLLPGGYDFHSLLGRFSVTGVEGGAAEAINNLSSNRLTIWRACVEDVMSNPLFGLGQNNYIYGCGDRVAPGSSQPHGSHIQLLLDWGIVGAIFFVAFISWYFRKAYSNLKQAGAAGYVAAISAWGVLMLLVFSAYDGTLFQRYSLMYFVLFLVLAVHPVKSREPAAEQEDNRNIYGALLLFVIMIVAWLATKGYPITPEYITI